MSVRKISLFIAAFFAFAVFSVQAQTPTPTPEDETEKIFSEEIKLNILAFDKSGKFASGVTKEDVVITEDGRIHQAQSVRRIPANVLIVLDVGGENVFGKNKKMTSDAAKALIGSLQAEDSVTVIQYADKVEFVSEWTTDKSSIIPLLNEKKLGQGVRSSFDLALDTAVKFFKKSALDNRHLVLITDGIDSFNDQKLRESWMKNLLGSDINVHVISYTKMAQTSINVNNSVLKGGESNPQRVPNEALIIMPQAQQQILTLPRLGSVNTDREMIKKRKEQTENLKKSEQNLTKIAEDTNGEIFLPESKDELIGKTGQIAAIIDSSYVVTYVPKRALSDVTTDEERIIEVTSKRNGLEIQSKRKLFVGAKK